jgi:hypothetical protein
MAHQGLDSVIVVDIRDGVIGNMQVPFDLLESDKCHQRADSVDRETVVLGPVILQLSRWE